MTILRILKIKTSSNESTVYCGKGAFARVCGDMEYESVFVVTDSNVDGIYGELIEKSFPRAVGKYVLPAGEKSKNYKELFNILTAMAGANLTRGSCVVAIGGGVVGDIGGLAASLYMRGVHLVQVATTLLAQVDSSVGGKTAVDLGKIKNAVGTFYQPETVIIDPVFLDTLPFREMRCGLGEILKYAAIDLEIYDKVSAQDDLFDRDFLEGITFDCISCKARVVGQDENDTNGVRAYLNAGHTVGHSLELYYGLRSHGEYVAIGLLYEMYFAKLKGLVKPGFYEEFSSLVGKVVPVMPRFRAVYKIMDISLHDKKNVKRGYIDMMAPCGRGNCERISVSEEDYFEHLPDAEREFRTREPVRLALVGRDVSKSSSDKIHTFICRNLGYGVIYDKISIPEGEFESRIEGVMSDYAGFNVTIPYKLSVLPHVKKLVGDAEIFGAVNTVCTASGEGYNTDGDGFSLMLKNAGIGVWCDSVLLIGSGGAGRSVAKKLRDLKCDVDVYSIDKESAKEVAERFGCTALNEIKPRHYDFIINASGVGMHESEGKSPVGPEIIRKCDVAVDLIYEPKLSQFLRIAHAEGLKALNGEAMLFYQAYYSDCAYFGLEPDAAEAKRLYKAYGKQIKERA